MHLPGANELNPPLTILSLMLYTGVLQGPAYYPMCFPNMPKEDVLENTQLHKLALELASILEVRSNFHEHADATDWHYRHPTWSELYAPDQARQARKRAADEGYEYAHQYAPQPRLNWYPT